MKQKTSKTNGNTKVEGVFWCHICNVPVSDDKCGNCGKETKYLAKDLKPIFEKERKLISKIAGVQIPDQIPLYRNLNRVIANGKTIFRFKVVVNVQANENTIYDLDIKPSKKEIEDEFHSIICEYDYKNYNDLLGISNYDILNKKIEEAESFIQSIRDEHVEIPCFISFSGGKDSVVVAHLVQHALPDDDIPLFFADTTLEAKETYDFINKFVEKYGFNLVDYDQYKSPKDFFELCQYLGPPSIFYRWCCTVFKSYPVNEFYRKYDSDILTFDGIRKRESKGRSKYNQISRVKKIPKQIAAYPIFEWSEFDIWTFIQTNGLSRVSEGCMYNPLYDMGQSRVGCVVCPAASPTNCFFRRQSASDKWTRFESILYDYAATAGRERNWVDSDYWRLRRPKQDKITAGTIRPSASDYEYYQPAASRLCGNNNSYVYTLGYDGNKLSDSGLFVNQSDITECENTVLTEEFLEFLKPFGVIQIIPTNNLQMFRITNPMQRNLATGTIGGSKFIVHMGLENNKKLKKDIDTQINKAINCVGCGGCIGICPSGAIEIINGKFTIDSNKCTSCKKCIYPRFSSRGCIALSYSLRKKVMIKEVS